MVSVLGTADAEPEDRIRAVIDWYGPSDLLTMPPNVLSEGRTREDLAKANGALLLGGVVMDRPALAKSASALHLASAGDVPFLEWLERGYDEAALKAEFMARGGFGDLMVDKVLRRE